MNYQWNQVQESLVVLTWPHRAFSWDPLTEAKAL